jgi:hypothetical protein
MKKSLLAVLLVCMLIFGTSAYAQDNKTAEEPPASTTSDDYEDFSVGQRWATFGLNYLMPGLGSLFIMKDKVGGTIQLVMYGIELGAFLGGYITMLDSMMRPVYTYEDGERVANIDGQKFYIGIYVMVGSGVIGTANMIYNAVRSANYHKPKPKIAAIIDPAAWNLTVIPSNNGFEQVSLSYKIRF